MEKRWLLDFFKVQRQNLQLKILSEEWDIVRRRPV
jgi:hypothetical protein